VQPSSPSGVELYPETLLATLLGERVPDSTTSEKRELLMRCRPQASLAEVAASLHLPLSVVRVIASDLIDEHLLSAGTPNPRLELMEAVLAGLQRL
jgi:hypothetical protein